MHIAFAQSDITPAPGQHIIGWIKEIRGHTVRDPLFLKVAILANDSSKNPAERIAFINLDALSIRWTHTQQIRQHIEQSTGFPAKNIMISATHTHAGGALSSIGPGPRDEPYAARITQTAADTFARALENLQESTLGIALGKHHTLPRNRRVVMRDGSVKTHGNLNDPAALCIEGPIDPELAVFFARNSAGKITGAIVNFTCHPVHHGHDGCFSAGWPGAMAAALKSHGIPITLFLNGALGNVHHSDPAKSRPEPTKDQAGQMIAADVAALIKNATDFRDSPRLAAAQTTLSLPFRDPTPDQIHATAHGAQRFIDSKLYDDAMPALLEKIKKYRGQQLAELQAFALDEFAFQSIPAELFVEHGLAIKEKSHPRHTLIVGLANGMIGYIPTTAAFARGGYETTFGPGSRMAPHTGDLIVEAATRLLKELPVDSRLT